MGLADYLEDKIRVSDEEMTEEDWQKLEEEFPFLRRKAE